MYVCAYTYIVYTYIHTNFRFSDSVFPLLFPPTGLAASDIDVLAGNEHTIPALAIVILCCSIASNSA